MGTREIRTLSLTRGILHTHTGWYERCGRRRISWCGTGTVRKRWGCTMTRTCLTHRTTLTVSASIWKRTENRGSSSICRDGNSYCRLRKRYRTWKTGSYIFWRSPNHPAQGRQRLRSSSWHGRAESTRNWRTLWDHTQTRSWTVCTGRCSESSTRTGTIGGVMSFRD